MKLIFCKRLVASLIAILLIFTMLPPVSAVAAGQEEFVRQTKGAATPENALSDEAYKDFGFQSLPEQEAFESSEHPLEDYKSASMSRLYVGYMNKSKSHSGSYAVYDAMPRLSKQAATISGNHAAGYLDAAPSKDGGSYEGISGVTEAEYRTLNSVSLDMGPNGDGSGGKPSVLCEAILLTGKDSGVSHAKKTSYLAVKTRVYDPVRGAHTTRNDYHIKLADSGDSIGKLDVRAAQGLNAVAAGDYNGDGVEELAVYVPNFSEPYIQIFDVSETGGITLGEKIVLNDLATPSDPMQYRFSFTGWNLPIVALATTDLAGHDSLAITACLPRSTDKNYRGHSPQPALALYKREQNGNMTREFLDHLNYGDYYMRFPNATEADVNGDGTGELVVAGYADTWKNPADTSTTPSLHAFTKYCVNLLVYNEADKIYQMAYTKPLEFTPAGDVRKVMAQDSGYAMSEPVALAAAKLSELTADDYLFLEGAVLSFRGAADVKKDAGELEKLAGGSLVKHLEMRMSPSAITVSHAVSGRFAANRQGSQQIALVWHDNYNHPNAVVDANITWIWTESNVVRQMDTNYQYLYRRDANGSGTFLSLARIDDTANRAVYSYEGKSYGWSAPNALVALPAVPHWKELPYEGGVGDVSFSVGNTLNASAGGSFTTSAGITFSVSAMAGFSLFDNGVKSGIGIDFSAALTAGMDIQGELSVGNTQTYSAPGDKNHVLVYATPMVTYEYNVWLADFTLTDELVREYKKQTGSSVVQDEKGTIFKPGDTIPAGWHKYKMHVPYSPTFSLITMEQYNAAYTKHTLGTGKIDMSAYDFTVGDPTTYKSRFSDIEYYNSVLKMVSHPKVIAANDVTNQVDFSGSGGLSGGVTVGLDYSLAVLNKVEGELAILVDLSGGLDYGVVTGGSSSFDLHTGFSVDIGTGASVNHLPSGYGEYGFQTTMGIWPCAGSGALLTTGFIVEPKADVPPKPPENPYVYETGMQNNGKAFMVIAWQRPKETEYRLAKQYDVFYKNAGASAGDYHSLGTVNALERNFIIAGELTPAATYDFAFKPISGDGHDGGISERLTATAASAGKLTVNPATPADVYKDTPELTFNHDFTVSASNTAMDETIYYQWQKYNAGDGYIGEWENIDGADGATYTAELETATADGDRYRCIVTAKRNNANPFVNPAPSQTVISRAATVHIGADPRYSVALSAQGTSGDLQREDSGEYFLPADGKAYLKAQVSHTSLPNIGDGSVALYYRKDGGAETKLTDGLTPENGEVTYEWTPPEAGTYNLAAVYISAQGAGIPGKLAVSEPLIIRAGTIEDEVYAVHYELNGGENSMANPSVVSGNARPIMLEAPTKKGASFEGWYEDAEFTQKMIYLDAQRIKAALGGEEKPYVLHARWTFTQYDVNYSLEGGQNNADNPNKYTLENSVTLNEPTKTGYRFEGWSFVNSTPPVNLGSTELITSLPLFDENNEVVAGDVTLLAEWELIEYPIVYHTPLAAGKGDNPDTYTVEDEIPLERADYTGTNFTHLAWYTDHTYQNILTDDKIAKGSTGPLSLFAMPKISFQYVFFFPLGGEYGGINPHTTSGQIDLRGASRQGFNFFGWGESATPDANGNLVADRENIHYADTSYTPRQMFDRLYAAWDAVPEQIEIRWLDSVDDTEIYLNHGEKGEIIADPNLSPTHYGYTFDGHWYRDKELTQPWDFANDILPDSLTGSFALYAGFREQYYTVNYETNGGTAVPAQLVREGQTARKPSSSRQEGETVYNWHADEGLTSPYDFASEVQSDITLYAEWGTIPPAFPPTPWLNPFSDIMPTDWFYEDVEYVVMNGLFLGTDEITFAPNMLMTRAMLTTVLWREAGSPVGGENPFTDVAEGKYYTDAVIWAAENGIAYGIGGGLFAPERNISRQDFAVMLMRYIDFIGYEYDVGGEYEIFADENEISDYAKNAVQILNKLGVIMGKGNDVIDPRGFATRAEAAAMLHRLLELMRA